VANVGAIKESIKSAEKKLMEAQEDLKAEFNGTSDDIYYVAAAKALEAGIEGIARSRRCLEYMIREEVTKTITANATV
jgi:uncharacterized protein (UPF0332 family)